jgi:tRNA threonylcarbamoyladenosine biosynthesis protein TsaB
VRDGALLATEYRALRHGHAEVLLLMIERVMAEAGLAPSQLDAVATAVGPGGFTGIRVGLAAAHGIALAVGARLVGISSFAAVAAGVVDRGCEMVLVALDSRRADLYVQLFASDATTPLAAPQALLADRLGDHVACVAAGLRPTSLSAGDGRDGRVLIAGDAAEAAAAALGGRVRCTIAGESAPDAQGVATAALRELASGAVPGAVRPFYLRPPDVTLPQRPLPQRPLPQRPRPTPAS